MPVETSAPVAGQTKTSVPMVPSVTRPARQIETPIEHATQDGSRATQYARRATQHRAAYQPTNNFDAVHSTHVITPSGGAVRDSVSGCLPGTRRWVAVGLLVLVQRPITRFEGN